MAAPPESASLQRVDQAAALDEALADWDQAQEASLFIALTHDLHNQFWSSSYYQEARLAAEAQDAAAKIKCSRIWFGLQFTKLVLSIISTIVPQLDLNEPVADLGTGNGHLCHLLQTLGFKNCVGLDYCQDAIDLAQELSSSFAAVVGTDGAAIDFRVADVCDVPFEPDHFKLVIDKGTLDCVGMCRATPAASVWDTPEPPTRCWAESVFRMLKPNGFLLVVSCCFDAAEVEELFENLDVLGSDEFEFSCLQSEERVADNGSKVTVLLFQKVAIGVSDECVD